MSLSDFGALVLACVIATLAGVGTGFLAHTLWTAVTG